MGPKYANMFTAIVNFYVSFLTASQSFVNFHSVLDSNGNVKTVGCVRPYSCKTWKDFIYYFQICVEIQTVDVT